MIKLPCNIRPLQLRWLRENQQQGTRTHTHTHTHVRTQTLIPPHSNTHARAHRRVNIIFKVKHGFGTFKWSTGQIYQVCVRAFLLSIVGACVLVKSIWRESGGFEVYVTRHASHVTHHTSHVTRHSSQGEWRDDTQNGRGIWTFPR